MGKYFGTDGFRGEANVTLTVDHAYKIGRFLAQYYRGEQDETAPRFLIAKDTRRSSYMLEYAMTAGITASGGDVYLLHVSTTPSVAHITAKEGFHCGIMISASHNPYYDNGIKLLNSRGEKMDDETISRIEDYLDRRDPKELPLATGDGIGRVIDYACARQTYRDYLVFTLPCSLQGYKVGLDCANGGAWELAGSVFRALGAETHVIHASPDGTNINKNAGSTHMESLRKLVVEKGLDVGFAFDGDADRCLCVDENGKVITGDHILYILAKYLKSHGKLSGNTVVTTVMSNLGLYKALDTLDIGYAKTDVGDKYVYEYMERHACSLGGEQSGHIILRDHATTGDGILTALKIMEVMAVESLTLGKLAQSVTIYPQVLKNIRVRSKEETKQDPAVQQAVEEVAQALGASGRILLRESGTEPLIRVMVEAPIEKLCHTYVDRILQIIHDQGHSAEK